MMSLSPFLKKTVPKHAWKGFSQEVLVVKNLPSKAGKQVSILQSGRSSGGGNDNPLQDSCLENPMDKRSWEG